MRRDRQTDFNQERIYRGGGGRDTTGDKKQIYYMTTKERKSCLDSELFSPSQPKENLPRNMVTTGD